MTFETLIESAPAGIIERLETLKGFRERADYHPEESCYEHIKIVTNRLIQTGNPDLIAAGILHDICKLETAKINPKNGYPTSPGHDLKAYELIELNLANKSNSWFIAAESWGCNFERVALICQQHMRIKTYDEMGDKKQRAFQKMEIFSDLLTFSCADDMLTEFVYPYSEFFPTSKHRDMWIRLNAKNQIAWEKNRKYVNDKTGENKQTAQALVARSFVDAVVIAKRQLEYDEKAGTLRYSFNELLTMEEEGLEDVKKALHKDWCIKMNLI